MTFKYSLVSDLHMDFPHTRQLSKMEFEQNVLIAGDLGNGLAHFKFVEKLRRRGHTVYATDGNHEHYSNKRAGRSIAETELRFLDLGGFTVEQQVSPELRLIAINGWYHVADSTHWKGYMSDGELVGCASEVNETARRHADMLAERLRRLPDNMKAIVMTHTAPCEGSLDPKYDGSPGNPYYWSPSMEHVLMAYAHKIKVWHHGHTHAAVKVKISGVPIITNPRGYPMENPEWLPLTCEL